MGKILCATRGGEASIRTQQAAIAEAKVTGDELVFIYIFDIEFMAHAFYGMRSDVVTEEMERMAEFLMQMVVERAAQAGIEARSLIRRGKFGEVLVEAAREEGATLVILGRPAEGGLFRLHELEALAERLAEESGIPFVIRP
ncbi:MAG: hypothetical protein Kow00124_16340 [Anaerolineae bacterium]